jgi:RHS repeat-associated protein
MRIPTARRTSLLVSSLVVVGALVAAPATPVQAAAESGPGQLQKLKKVKGHDLKAGAKAADHKVDEAGRDRRVRAALPRRGSATLHARPGARRGELVDGVSSAAGTLPVRAGWVKKGTGASSDVTVTTLSEKQAAALGVRGVVLRVDSTVPAGASALQLDVDYSAFADAFGGDWASRLRLVSLPACALEKPEASDCRETTELSSLNAAQQRRVSASLPFSAFGHAAGSDGGARDERASRAAVRTAARATALATATTTSTAVVALEATDSGGAGDWGATSLTSSALWSAGGNGGSFTWSYPLRMPPGVNGPTPSLEIGYDSGAIDGRVSSSNNQSSWIGEGWSLGEAFVERSYVGCADDMASGNNKDKTGDLCWKTENATLVLPGHTSELVKDSTSGKWYLKKQDGSRIERLTTGATNADNDGENWVLTTPDGTKYHFGLGKRYSTDTAATNSTWTVPVAGNHSGEDCFVKDDFAKSFCTQAWRWNLDYVVDANGNTMTYFYTPETNRYRRSDTAKSVSYVRGGYLARIEYGTRKGSEASASAPAKVTFTTAERCIPNSSFTCATTDLTSTNASKWPDVPFDRICTNTTECTTKQAGPSFFSRKRLTTVNTYIYTSGAYAPVDSWSLGQSFPATGDSTSPALWLSSITHTGKVGGTDLSTPAVTFGGTQLRNRVQNVDGGPSLVRWRVSQVNSESGGRIDVSYLPAQCTASTLPTPHTNKTRCFPSYWMAEGASEQTITWFQKYPVSQVVESDLTGLSPAKVTSYEYEGDPAWHYDDNELGKRSRRTYSDWRGYPTVKTLVGDPSGPKLVTKATYMRGMNGDRLPDGTTRSVTVEDSQNGTITDSEAANGFELETITYLGNTTTEVSGEINRPWISAVVASGGGDSARFVDVLSTTSRTNVSVGSDQVTKVTNTYDPTSGLLTQVDDAGDIAIPGDESCTGTKYTSNPTLNILDTVSEVEVVSVGCSAPISRPANVVSHVRSYYDGSTSLTAAPSRGLVTQTDQRSGARTDASTPFLITDKTTYDVHGRVLTKEDGDGRKVFTAYTPTTGGPVTKVVTTNALSQTSTTVLLPQWGVPDSKSETNGAVTSGNYDALGRLIAVWQPGSVRGTDSASVKFGYTVSKSAPSTVKTQLLLPSLAYRTSVALYDGLVRQRQMQEAAYGSDGGRLVTDTLYDGRGLTIENNGPYWASGTAGTTPFVPTSEVPNRTVVDYDGAGREVKSSLYSGGTLRWSTQTAYGGNWVAVTPPSGGTPTREITDALGQTVEVREYTSGSPVDDTNTAYVKTLKTYMPDGQPATAAGPMTASATSSASTWRYTYDLAGRLIETVDPDNGTSRKTYTAAGLIQSTKDARGSTVWNVYDSIGRQKESRVTSATGALLVKRVYDTVKVGMLTSSTRYVGSDAFTTSVGAYDTAGRPTSSTVTIPDSFGALKGAYTSSTTYNAVGNVARVIYPKVGDLAAEAVTTSYDANGQPLALTGSGTGTYVNGTLRSSYGEALRYAMNLTASGSGFAWQSFAYEDGTRRLQSWKAERENVPGSDADVSYSYDASGNVTSTADKPTGTGRKSDVQCFNYDGLGRMSQAWTPASSCAVAPDQALLAGAAPYWQKLSYDVRGNRTTEEAWTPSATASRGYTYGSPAGQPDALTKVTTTGATTRTDTFGYDEVGNTTTRNIGSAAQSLTWDEFGKAASTTAASKVTQYFYDADGNRLARTNPAAAGTLVPAAGATVFVGGAELTLAPGATTATATRYYTFDGRTVASRTAAGVKLVLGDSQGTAQLQIDGATGTVTRRYSLPFGGDRSTLLTGSASSSSVLPSGWAGQQGFVGGTQDGATGLINVGARLYDAATGRFISVDPVFDGGNPQSWNGYAYAGNAPATHSDPTGLCYGLSPKEMAKCGQGWKTADKVLAKGKAQARHYVKPTRNKWANWKPMRPRIGPPGPWDGAITAIQPKTVSTPKPAPVLTPYYQMQPTHSAKGDLGALKDAYDGVGTGLDGAGAAGAERAGLAPGRAQTALARWSKMARIGGPTTTVIVAGMETADRVNKGESGFKAFTKAVLIAGAQAGGAALGGLTFGALGSLVGPEGTVIGAGVGAVVVGAAAGEGTEKLLDKWW